MCGLVGVVGHKNAPKLIKEVLKHLEYRGYDSWGYVATRQEWAADKNNLICGHFVNTPISVEPNKDDMVNYDAYWTGLGHTRWATNGEVSVKNTHPIFSSANSFAVVHNGIYKSDNLKEGESDTAKFVSNLEFVFNVLGIELSDQQSLGPILDILQRMIWHTGENIFLVQAFNIYDTIFAVAQGKTLWLGDNGVLCSDLTALSITGAKKAAAIENACLAIKDFGNGRISILCDDCWTTLSEMFRDDELHYFTIYNVPHAKTSEEDNSEHFMLKEIREQANLKALPNLKLSNPIFVGCGSSYFAGKFAKYYYRHHGMTADCEYASEMLWDNIHDRDVVFITQSGETKDVLDRMKRVKGATLVTNNVNSVAAKMAGDVYNIGAGPEYSVAATKTFFRTCLSLIPHKREHVEALAHFLSEEIPIWEKEFAEIAKNMYKFQKVIFLGTGYTYPIAQEAALKMKEVAQVWSDALPAAEIKHGPIALADDTTLCIAIGRTTPKIRENISQIKARGATAITLDDFMSQKFDLQPPEYYALASVIPCQLLAYYTAIEKGLNPDRPTNLAKCVTV